MRSPKEIIEKLQMEVYEYSSEEVKKVVDRYHREGMLFETKVVGTSFNGGQEILKRLDREKRKDRYRVVLSRERGNEEDPNAVAVWLENEKKKRVRLGYINKNLAKLFVFLGNMGVSVGVEGYHVSGGGGYRRGMVVFYRLKVRREVKK